MKYAQYVQDTTGLIKSTKNNKQWKLKKINIINYQTTDFLKYSQEEKINVGRKQI